VDHGSRGLPWAGGIAVLAGLVLVSRLAMRQPNPLDAFFWCEKRDGFYWLWFGLLSSLVTLKLALAAWGFTRSLCLNLVSPRFVAGYAGLWLAGVCCLGTVAWAEWAQTYYQRGTMLFVPAAFLVLPLVRIAFAPLALAMNRHG
jgi:hypothetical protein